MRVELMAPSRICCRIAVLTLLMVAIPNSASFGAEITLDCAAIEFGDDLEMQFNDGTLSISDAERPVKYCEARYRELDSSGSDSSEDGEIVA